MKAVRPLDGSERSFSIFADSVRCSNATAFTPSRVRLWFQHFFFQVLHCTEKQILNCPHSAHFIFKSFSFTSDPWESGRKKNKSWKKKERQRRNGTIEKVLTHCGLYLCGCYGYKSSLDTYNKMVDHHICRCTEMFPHSENDSGFACSYHACGGSGHRWWTDHECLSASRWTGGPSRVRSASWIQRDLQQNLTFRKSFRRQIL